MMAIIFGLIYIMELHLLIASTMTICGLIKDANVLHTLTLSEVLVYCFHDTKII